VPLGVAPVLGGAPPGAEGRAVGATSMGDPAAEGKDLGDG
jgi:hypothetical protein